jgi:hypothetical protein
MQAEMWFDHRRETLGEGCRDDAVDDRADLEDARAVALGDRFRPRRLRDIPTAAEYRGNLAAQLGSLGLADIGETDSIQPRRLPTTAATSLKYLEEVLVVCYGVEGQPVAHDGRC